MNNLMFVLGAALPSLDNVTSWWVTQGKDILFMIVVFVLLKYVFKQQIGKAVGLAVFAGLVWFVITDPQTIFTAIANLFKMLFG